MTTIEQEWGELEEHPFLPFIPQNATKLIIGSIPPQRFWKNKDDSNSLHSNDVNFYYGSRNNHFWLLVGKVFNISFEIANTQSAINQRKQFLNEKSIGITDVVGKCTRLNGSSEDKNLRNIEHKKLDQLLIDNPLISTLVYTSDFIKQQVTKIFNTPHLSSNPTNKEYTLQIKNKIYNVKILFSPSPNALRNMGKDGKERRLKQYQQVLSE